MEEPVARPRGGRGLIGQSVVFYVSIYVFAFFKFVGGFVIARLLGPMTYGLRAKFGLVTDYEHFMHLGTYDALQREVPFLRGRGESDAVRRVLDTAFTVNMAYASVVAVLSVAASLLLRLRQGATLYADFALFLAAWVVLSKTSEYFRASLVTEKRTDVLSVVNATYGFVNAAAGILLTWRYDLRGLFVALILGELVRVAMLVSRASRMPRLAIDGATLRRLYAVGFPIMLIALMFVILRNVDRVIIASMLPEEKLGYFAVGTVVSGLIYLSVGELSRVMLFPRVMERLGAGGDSEEARTFLEGPSLMIAYLLPYIMAAIYLLIPVPIQAFLPEFTESIRVAQLLVLGSFYFSVVAVPILICVALNRQVRLVGLSAAAIVLNATLSVSLIVGGFDIDGVAIGTGVSYLIFCSITLAFAQSLVGVPGRTGLWFHGLVHLPFLWTCLLLFGLGRWSVWSGDGQLVDGLNALARLGVFGVAFSPVLAVAARWPAVRRSLVAVRSAPPRG